MIAAVVCLGMPVPAQAERRGRLAPEIIQRVVRRSFRSFRRCYEAGLRPCPNLNGRVSVTFVIGRDGRVKRASGKADIPDAAVIDCVVKRFRSLVFPAPEGGSVTVIYPILFTPGG